MAVIIKGSELYGGISAAGPAPAFQVVCFPPGRGLFPVIRAERKKSLLPVHHFLHLPGEVDGSGSQRPGQVDSAGCKGLLHQTVRGDVCRLVTVIRYSNQFFRHGKSFLKIMADMTASVKIIMVFFFKSRRYSCSAGGCQT